MVRDNFLQRKEAVLSKLDKSSIGGWDKPIQGLCDKINKSNDFYTTSSCSGRAVLMIEQEKKAKGLFLETSHDLISFDWLKKSLLKIENSGNKDLIKFKLEQPILHVACRDLDVASDFLEKAKHIGFKRSGILANGKNIILELNSTERLEFPIMNKGKILVDDDFLKIIAELSNEKLKRGWEKIKDLKKLV
jgi:tRNA wybutosine-synthesizing protein 3